MHHEVERLVLERQSGKVDFREPDELVIGQPRSNSLRLPASLTSRSFNSGSEVTKSTSVPANPQMSRIALAKVIERRLA